MHKVNAEVAKNIGLIIKFNRRKRNISQVELAKKIGITRTYLNLIENQKKIPSFLLLKEIADQLGKTITELELEAISEDYNGELLTLKVIADVKKIIQGTDRIKQQKLVEFMEVLINS